jgi:hypothetical protein
MHFQTLIIIIRGGVIPARELITIKGAVAMNANVLIPQIQTFK